MRVGHGNGDKRYFHMAGVKRQCTPKFCNSTKIGNSLNFWSAVYACKSTCMSWGWTIFEFHPAESNEHLRASAKTFHFLLSKAVSRNVKFQIQSCKE
jgi:hypothetical protein